MNNLALRILTGVVYIAVILCGLFTTKEIFFAIFGIIMFFLLNELYKNLKIKGLTVNLLLSNILAASIFFLPILNEYVISFNMLPVVIAISLILFAIELFQKHEEPFHRIAYSLFGIVYIVLPFVLLAYYKCQVEDNMISSLMIFSLFLFTWSNDSFAYVWGMLFGKHLLCPSISPKKTIEGFVGGLLSTVGISILLVYFLPNYYNISLVGLSVVVVVFSTLGDLIESRLKRYIGVKDSGKVLPGHGGWLDRFDSVIFSIPAFFIYLQI